ncbi:ribonuclease H [Trifolium pratense]|uniref:Ribonuclease H n=2 Tax=Trifolium TaxID=3898 RepID=A0A2K3PEZ3_TRIPR|nr:ribonuclease H [Trifolium pratense]
MQQCISFIVNKGSDKWLCSAVYASPVATMRPFLWEFLDYISKTVSLPWLAIGDFNDILLPREQKGGVFSNSKADLFASNVDKCGLIDLGSFGTKFTWQGKCRGGRIVHRRLDRGLGNYDWRMKFPEATVEHLVRRHSDHNPIYLRCSNVMLGHEDRPFRFQAAWFTHNEYPNLVRNTWNRDRGNIAHCLQNVAKESTTFNKEVFGNIFARKKEVEARLRGIQRALEDIDSANLLRLQKGLLDEYDNILFQEETLWYQKSRENLIRLGSRNTSFFHAQSIIRRKRNKIHGIKLSSGEWCTDPEIIKSEAQKFFKELFCTNQQASSNTILWNGSKTEPFSPMRGLRQGDPLSPYLFVLCMERLGMMISSSVSNGSWKPMQITKDGTKLSHLFFADDVLLFAKANVSQARVVNNVLERFCALSGLKISLDKSKFCTSTGVCRRLRDTIAATTQIHATDRFDKYLGFKMFYGKVRKQDFNDIYDRVSAKLASWKGRLLNKPGRVVLANSVISALPSYHMQIHWLPQGMCDDLDRIVRKFIWKGTGGSGMHLVGWNKITQPRRYGGLGVRIARIQNVFLLGKLVWEILNSPSKLWVTLFAEKYLKGRLIFNVSVAGGSLIWNSIAKALRMLQDGFWFKIGDGNTNFWFEPWLYRERLSTAVPFVAIQDTDLNIKDVWYNNRWNLETLYTILPDDVKTAILELKLHVVTDLPDVWVWNNASSGIFSPKDAYEWLLQPQPIYNHSNWKWIWQLRLPANIQFLYSQFLYIICLHFTE